MRQRDASSESAIRVCTHYLHGVSLGTGPDSSPTRLEPIFCSRFRLCTWRMGWLTCSVLHFNFEFTSSDNRCRRIVTRSSCFLLNGLGLNSKLRWRDRFTSTLRTTAGLGQFGSIAKNKLAIQTGRGIDHKRVACITRQGLDDVGKMLLNIFFRDPKQTRQLPRRTKSPHQLLDDSLPNGPWDPDRFTL